MGRKLWGGLSKCILIVSKKWWRFCSKKSLHNRTWRKNIFAFPQKYFSGRVVKTAINLSREKTFFFKKKLFFESFSVFQQKLFGFLAENFMQVCQPAFYVSIGTSSRFLAENKSVSFLDINWDIISPMAKLCWQAWQKWMVSVHEKFLKEFDTAKNNFFFIVPGHRVEQKRRFGQKTSAKLSKLHLRGPKKTLWLNTLLEEVNFYYNFGILKEKFSAFAKRLSTGF